MALGLNNAITCFQKKIGTYDKANWEITVENQTIPQISDKCKIAKLPTDLLDVDLIRGSTFTKSKPCYNWAHVTTKGLMQLVFFPFYHSWWRTQMLFPVWIFFLALYFLQLLALVIYGIYQADESFADISWPEASVPIMASILVGELYIHVISSNVTKPIAHKIKKSKSRSDRSPDKIKRKGRKEKRKSQQAQKGILKDKLYQSDEGIYSLDSRKEVHDSSPDRVTSREDSVERELDTDDVNKIIGQPDFGNVLRKRAISKNRKDSNQKGKPEKKLNLEDSTDSLKDVSRHSTGSSSTSSEEENSDSDTSTLSESENAMTHEDTETQSVLFPNDDGKVSFTKSDTLMKIRNNHDLITVSIWHGSSFKKTKLTFFEIGLEVAKKVERRMDSENSEYLKFSIAAAILIGILPLLFRMYQSNLPNNGIKFLEAVPKVFLQMQSIEGLHENFKKLFGATVQCQIVVFIAMVARTASSFCMFFLLCVAEVAFKKRYTYAKFFGALTSTRRARRNGVPHFRLHKVKNIKAWLSLRSFLKKLGPQRSIDIIVSVAFIFGILLLVICCVQFLSVNDQKDHFLTYFFSWEVSVWSMVLGIFLIRFITIGSDINRKNKYQSVLLTEQVNLYLQMERKAEKKEELLIANNVLKLATKLLKEVEGSFQISGFIMNPLLSNITRVVVLSFFSGVMSDILGFRLRLWKIKTG